MKLVGCPETPHFLGSGSAHARTGPRGSFADLIVADRPIAGLSWLEYGTAIEALIGGAELSHDETQVSPPRTAANRRAGARGGGYKIAGQVPTTLVVLHCGPELLSERLGLALREAPEPLRALAGPGLAAGVSNRVSLTPELFRAAQWIHASRYSVLSTVR